MENSSRIVMNRQHAYKCKTCGKGFDTFQALGGHQGLHKKANETFLSLSIVAPMSSSGLHRCKMCTEVFESGPALGGHMTRHRHGKDLAPMETRERQAAVESGLMVAAVEQPRVMKAEEDEGGDVRKELILAAKEWRLCL